MPMAKNWTGSRNQKRKGSTGRGRSGVTWRRCVEQEARKRVVTRKIRKRRRTTGRRPIWIKKRRRIARKRRRSPWVHRSPRRKSRRRRKRKKSRKRSKRHERKKKRGREQLVPQIGRRRESLGEMHLSSAAPHPT